VIGIDDLPAECREQVRVAASLGAHGRVVDGARAMAAWGDYDIKASRQLNAYVLLVEW